MLARGAHRSRRRVLVGALVVAAIMLVVVAAASWLSSSLLIDPHHDLARENVDVKGVAADRVGLARLKTTLRPGAYGLDWRRGHAVVGDVVARTHDTVTRRLLGVRGELARGVKVAIDPDVWEGNPRSGLGITFSNVAVPARLRALPGGGALPGWRD